MEDADPRLATDIRDLATDIRDLVEPRPHTDPELKTDRRYTDLAAREILDRLRTGKGYTPVFGPRETSDLGADGLGRWWEQVRGGLGHIRRLVVYLDSGPNNAGTRTQLLSRMVGLADATGSDVRLVYDPSYHRKYNPVERCGRPWSGSGGVGG